MTEALTQFINSTGWLAPLYYVGSFVVTALLPIVPTPLVGALGGKAFGLFPAAAYGIFGLGLGAFISLNLARRIGRPLINRLVRPKTRARWEELLGIQSVVVWGLLFLLLNLDFVVLLSGLTTLPLRKLWLAAMIARSPWLVASAWFGDVILVSDSVMWVALLLTLPILYGLNRLQPRIQSWLIRISNGRIPPP